MFMDIEQIELSLKERKAVCKLLERLENQPPELENLWELMDSVWDELGCDNRRLDSRKVSDFYRHPIWLLNGLFIETHDLSIQHRLAIADWVTQNSEIYTVLDYGGGFGTLARFIAQKNKDIVIDVYEPYPSESALIKAANYTQISFVNTLNKRYGCLVSTDVLEHVPDPLELLAQMAKSIELNGFLIIANCFYPVIKCHLPCTFHLRYSFNLLAKMMGLEFITVCQNSHASIYRKVDEAPFNWFAIRSTELLSKTLFPILENSWGYRFIKSTKDLVDSLRKLFF
ncbi:methyltransferase domain-containing protein [Trichocoleus sp. FACHB-46]|nr:methyltransferase domain-containing protein [Trichocoleus sp. FACHB-46]